MGPDQGGVFSNCCWAPLACCGMCSPDTGGPLLIPPDPRTLTDLCLG